MVTARDLFNDYRYYRAHTAHVQKLKQEKPFLRDLKETPARIQLFVQLIQWCQDREINPKQWLYSLFATRRWLFAPKLAAGHLLSENHIPKFKKFTEYQLYRQRQMEQEAQHSSTAFDPNRDISHTAEEAKRFYLSRNNADGCIAKMRDETFGYHPRSVVCVQCPAALKCRQILESSVQFDIMALRQGTITSEEAKSQALARIQSYDD